MASMAGILGRTLVAARPLLSGNGAQGFVRTGGAGVSAHCAVATAAAPAAPLSSRPCGGEGYEEVLSKVEKQLGSFASTPMLPTAPGLVMVICGPSGVGKDSVIHELKKQRSDLHFVVTATTRPKRPGEIDGVDYIFTSKETFEEWIAKDLLLEHALVYGEYKGIPREQVEGACKEGKTAILRVDIQGTSTVKKLMPESITVFLTAESEANLVERLVRRQTESMEKLLVRIPTARKELSHIHEFDYAIVNEQGKVEEAASKISSIIDVEKMKTRRIFGTSGQPTKNLI